MLNKNILIILVAVMGATPAWSMDTPSTPEDEQPQSPTHAPERPGPANPPSLRAERHAAAQRRHEQDQRFINPDNVRVDLRSRFPRKRGRDLTPEERAAYAQEAQRQEVREAERRRRHEDRIRQQEALREELRIGLANLGINPAQAGHDDKI